uniref:Uncharacterized protein n=2 Tax=environmental samples TaxID=68359 RepID=A0A075GQE2_9EURY|nr:hypothetical protein [uncultured marine group II/III euryarchaeote KM3_190_A12]AIF07591.1 hypothetical protein [uncultured marine group II/III euryarchaeote KM3_205_C10]
MSRKTLTTFGVFLTVALMALPLVSAADVTKDVGDHALADGGFPPFTYPICTATVDFLESSTLYANEHDDVTWKIDIAWATVLEGTLYNWFNLTVVTGIQQEILFEEDATENITMEGDPPYIGNTVIEITYVNVASGVHQVSWDSKMRFVEDDPGENECSDTMSGGHSFIVT